MLFNILMYVFMAYMIVRVILLSKSNKKNNKMINIIKSISDKDYVFEKTEELLAELPEEDVYQDKVRIIKLWAHCYHGMYEGFSDTLNEIRVEKLVTYKKNRPSIAQNEDSFFYLYLTIPNILYKDKEEENRKQIIAKMKEYEDLLKDELLVHIAEACNMFYDNEGDLGQSFFEKVLEGDYGEFYYNKQMIGFYKNICGTMLTKIYEMHGETEKYEEIKYMAETFNKTHLGQRWVKAIDLDIEETEQKIENEEPVTEEDEAVSVTEDSEENSEE